MSLRILLLAVAALCGTTAPANAAILVNYTFPASETTPSIPRTATTIDSSVTVSLMNDTVGDFDVSASSSTAFLRASASESTLALAIATPDYLQFTLTPNAGYTIDLTSFVFAHAASNDTTAYTSNFSLFASLDGFASTPIPAEALGTSTENVAANIGNSTTVLDGNVTFSLAFAQFQGLTSADTVTFRMYGFDDAGGSTQISRVDSLRVNGDVTAVPEPGSVALALFGSLGLFGMIRRRLQG